MHIYVLILHLIATDFTGRDVMYSRRMFGPWIDFIRRVKGFSVQHADLFSVSFSYEVSQGLSLEVDLLVSPYWDTPQDFYQFPREIPKQERIK